MATKTKTKILVIDNYDSFVYNLVQYFGEQGAEVIVRRNEISVPDALKLKPDAIVLSPGPGHPKDSKATLEILKRVRNIPILGVCLGHQAIAEAFGGKVIRAKNLLHGKTSEIFHNGKGIFSGIPSPFPATRYHSLIIERETIPSCLEIVAETKEKEIMSVKHREFPIYGVQFHPESVLTGHGKDIIRNFLKIAKEAKKITGRVK